jgi:hypothetical protein
MLAKLEEGDMLVSLEGRIGGRLRRVFTAAERRGRPASHIAAAGLIAQGPPAPKPPGWTSDENSVEQPHSMR